MYRINADDEEISPAAIFRIGEAVCSLKLWYLSATLRGLTTGKTAMSRDPQISE
jgi:hypothetical protein